MKLTHLHPASAAKMCTRNMQGQSHQRLLYTEVEMLYPHLGPHKLYFSHVEVTVSILYDLKAVTLTPRPHTLLR